MASTWSPTFMGITVAQGDGLEVGGIHLDDGDIVILIAADVLGVVGVAVVHGDLDGVGELVKPSSMP